MRYGCPAIQQMLPIYKTIAVEVLAGTNIQELQALKEMLHKLCENLGLQLDPTNPIFMEFDRYRMICHFLLLKDECLRLGLHRIYAKICVSLLRYTREIRADKAFLDAGEACRKEGWNSMAVVIFNRYLDLYDAIEDPDAAAAENSDFADTDIPSPYDIPLPDKNVISADERDQIRDWVLQINMDQNTPGQLNRRMCEHCGADVYEACLSCPSCRSQWEPCIVTGYPLLKTHQVACKFSNKGALRDDYNEYISVAMHSPW